MLYAYMGDVGGLDGGVLCAIGAGGYLSWVFILGDC